jgi:hypothetical protein
MYGAIAGSASGLVSGYAGAVASRKTAAAEQRANEAAKKAALEEEQKAYEFESGKLKPWEEFGDKSRLSFQDLLGYNGPDAQAAALKSLQGSTGYKARMQATDRGSNARGGYFSGRAGLALQDAASEEYDQEYNRRAGLAGRAYDISKESMDRGGGYYRNRRDILSESLLRGGKIQGDKWRGYNKAQSQGNQTAAAGWGADSGEGYGGKKKKDSY